MKKYILPGLLSTVMIISLTACAETDKALTGEEDAGIRFIEEKVVTSTEKEEKPSEGSSSESKSSESIPSEEKPSEGISSEGSSPIESLSEESIFMNFLNGKTEAMLDVDFEDSLNYVCQIYRYESPGQSSSTLEGLESFTYDELKSAVDATSDLNLTREERYYGIFNTTSGGKALAIKFQNLSIYDPMDNSYAVFLFTIKNGQLFMTYAYDSWDRNYVEISENLIFTGYGSSGAGDNTSSVGYLDDTGHYKLIYNLQTLYDDWVAMYDWEDFGMDTEWSRGCTFCLLTTSDGSYYFYEAKDTVDSQKLGIFLNYLEKNGMTKIDSVEDAINAAYQASGIANEQTSPFDNWVPWN